MFVRVVVPCSWPRNERYPLFILGIYKLDTFWASWFLLHLPPYFLNSIRTLLKCFDIMAPVAYTPPEPQPPPGPQNLSGDYRNSMRTWDIVTQVICLIISTICIGLRMYSKIYIVRNPGWEDCKFGGLALFCGYDPLNVLSVLYRDLLFGLGMLFHILFPPSCCILCSYFNLC